MALIDLSFDEAGFSGWVPLFPLPGAVLLPGAILPLHVFEPRYRDLVRDALAGERLLAPALLEPGYEADYHDAPPVDPAVCVGRIVMEEELPDGRFNLVVMGLRRARIEEEDRSRSYRLARVALRPDSEVQGPAAARAAERLAAAVERLPAGRVRHLARLGTVLRLLQTDVPGAVPLGAGLDLVADAVALDPGARQQLLREPDVLTRLETFLAMLEASADPPPYPWPPQFSRN